MKANYQEAFTLGLPNLPSHFGYTHIANPALLRTDIIILLLVLLSRNPPFFATVPCSHKATRSDCIAGFGVLTVCRVRHITSPSWRPAHAGNLSLRSPDGRTHGGETR